ncbi:MAG: carbohydrate kinase family protein [Chloroflexi bacterium]|nr:carbohydrate kinase family protein [Chloroflexota bacterium]
MMGGEILLLGDINVDTILPIPEFPVPGRDGLASHMSVAIGGAVVNTAFVLDNLSQKTILLGCVGADVWAEKIKQDLTKTNIDIKGIHTKSSYASGLTFIIVTPDGERTMFSYRGANTRLAPEDIKESTFQNAGLLHISGYAFLESPQKDTAWHAIELAKEKNIPVSLDTGLDPVVRDPDEMRQLLSELTICITGKQEISVLSEGKTMDEAAKEMLSMGIQLVAVKMGERGCLVYNHEEKFAFPSFFINVVDTTGAGDSFTAGFLYSWMKKLGLSASTILASALGALATTVYGAGSSLPQKQTLVDFLQFKKSKCNSMEQRAIEEVLAVLESTS